MCAAVPASTGFPLPELYRLPGATPHQEHTLSGDELIVSVEIPAGAYTSRSHYLKVRDRESYEFALVSVAAALHEEGGVIRAARLAAGGVGGAVETSWRRASTRGTAQRGTGLAYRGRPLS